MRSIVLASTALLLAGCTSRPLRPVSAPPTPPPAAIIDTTPADLLVERGCYRCLLEAFTIYETALASPAPPAGLRARAFATAVLLALREKDLDLEATRWMEQAGRLASPEDAPYVELLAAMPWNGGAIADFTPDEPLRYDVLERWRRRVLPLERHPLVDRYVLLGLSCRLDTRDAFRSTVLGVDLTRPLLRYAVGICSSEGRPELERLLVDEPRFAEASYFIGRYEMLGGVVGPGGSFNRQWLRTAVAPLERAYEALPEAPTVATVFAGLMRSRRDLPRALELYDAALEQRPTHADALLGRAIVLTYLERPDEAIDAASAPIRLRRGHVASAYYYRAWNHYQKRQLEWAAIDVAMARRLNANEEVLVLSGMVAYDQGRPLDARADFQDAVAGNANRCIAHWYLGLLALDDQAWPAATTTFAAAGNCYVAAADGIRREAAQLPEDLPPDVRTHQLAALEEDASTHLRQAGRSFFNAASAAMRQRDTDAALAHAKRATGFDDVRERAEAIVRTLER
jgi:tetratricopeptide (TPR) repeat protein